MPTIPEGVQWMRPLAAGEDRAVDLKGPSAAGGWSVEADAAMAEFAEADPAIAGVTVSYTGGSLFTHRLTVPSVATATLPNGSTLYVTVWRTDAGNRRPLARLAFPIYTPVRPAT